MFVSLARLDLFTLYVSVPSLGSSVDINVFDRELFSLYLFK